MITFIDHIYLLQEKPSGKAALWTWETHGITKEGHLGIRERGVGDKGRWGVTCNEKENPSLFLDWRKRWRGSCGYRYMLR